MSDSEETKAETERYLRDRVEELEILLIVVIIKSPRGGIIIQ